MFTTALLVFLAGPAVVRGHDRDGEPLPRLAALRLGSTRWRFHWPKMAFAPDGRTLAAGSREEVQILEVESGRVLRRLDPDGEPYQIAFTSDGKSLTTLTFHHDWDLPRGLGQRGHAALARFALDESYSREAHRFDMGLNWDFGFRLSPDARILAKWERSGDRPMILLDAAAGRILGEAARPASGYGTVALAPGGRWIVVATQRGGLELLERGKLVRRLERENNNLDRYYTPAFSPDASFLLASEYESLARYEVPSGRRTAFREGVGRHIVIRPDGLEAACFGEDGAHLVDPVTLKDRLVLPALGRRWTSLAYSADSRVIAIGWEGSVALHDVRTGKRLNPTAGHESDVSSLAFTPDGSCLASGDVAGNVHLWDPATGGLLRSLRAEGPISCLAFSPDGRQLAVGHGNSSGNHRTLCRARVWDLSTGGERLSISPHLHGVTGIAFTPDAKTLVTAGSDDRVRWWGLATGRRLAQVRQIPDPGILGVRPEGAFVLGSDGLLERLRPDGSRLPLVPRGNREWRAPAFQLADGRLLIPRPDGIALHDPRNGVRVGSARAPVPRGQPYRVLAASPDGRFLACVLGYPYDLPRTPKPAALYDLAAGQSIATLCPDALRCKLAAFSPSSSRLVLAMEDGTLSVYDVRELEARWHLEGWLPDAEGRTLLLARHPEGMTRLLARLRESAAAEARARALIPTLASDDYDERERANDALARLGELAAHALAGPAASARELEVRLRCRRLLERLTPEARQRWQGPGRLARVLRFLHGNGWPGAEALLRELASLPDGTLAASEARIAREDRP
jgi:WD40 repeat protein